MAKRIRKTCDPAELYAELLNAACDGDQQDLADLMLQTARTQFPMAGIHTARVVMCRGAPSQEARSPSKSGLSRTGQLATVRRRPIILSDDSSIVSLMFGPPDRWSDMALYTRRSTDNPCSTKHVERQTKHAVYKTYPSPWNRTQQLGLMLEQDAPAGNEQSQIFESFLCPAFYYAGLATFNIIDTRTLEEWFGMLGCLKPAQLMVMREIVCSSRHELSLSADRLGLSKRTVEKHIYDIMKAVETRLPKGEDGKGYRSQMVDLFNAFYFLKFSAGASTETPQWSSQNDAPRTLCTKRPTGITITA